MLTIKDCKLTLHVCICMCTLVCAYKRHVQLWCVVFELGFTPETHLAV